VSRYIIFLLIDMADGWGPSALGALGDDGREDPVRGRTTAPAVSGVAPFLAPE